MYGHQWEWATIPIVAVVSFALLGKFKNILYEDIDSNALTELLSLVSFYCLGIDRAASKVSNEKVLRNILC